MGQKYHIFAADAAIRARIVVLLPNAALSAPSRKRSGIGASFMFGLSTEETQRRAEQVGISRDSRQQRKRVRKEPRALDWKKLRLGFLVMPKQCAKSLKLLSAEVLSACMAMLPIINATRTRNAFVAVTTNKDQTVRKGRTPASESSQREELHLKAISPSQRDPSSSCYPSQTPKL